MSKYKLKPCPFCGGQAEWEEGKDVFGDSKRKAVEDCLRLNFRQ